MACAQRLKPQLAFALAAWLVFGSAHVSRADCFSDLNGDASVNGADIEALLGAWGPHPGDAADFNTDGVVNAFDLAMLLGSWGPCATAAPTMILIPGGQFEMGDHDGIFEDFPVHAVYYDNPQGPADGNARVFRGCTWASFVDPLVPLLGCAFRAESGPSYKDSTTGFRVVAREERAQSGTLVPVDLGRQETRPKRMFPVPPRGRFRRPHVKPPCSRKPLCVGWRNCLSSWLAEGPTGACRHGSSTNSA